MSVQLWPIGTIAFASALLALGLSVPGNVAFADDCLTAPTSPAPPSGHWYYRTDRTQQRKCWHLQTENAQSEDRAVQTTREAPAKPSQSIAADHYAGPGFKDFMAQHVGAKLSDQDVENLYAEFLEWKQCTKN